MSRWSLDFLSDEYWVCLCLHYNPPAPHLGQGVNPEGHRGVWSHQETRCLWALTAVGLLQTICWQCFTAPQSTAVFTSLHSTAEPPEHVFGSWTGLVRAKGEPGT